MKKSLLIVLLACVLIVGCSGGGKTDGSIQAQLRGSQGLLMQLQNSGDLDHLYMFYDGPTTDAAMQQFPSPNAGPSIQQIGELNLLLHNIGGSATVGGLFVSGYDPGLISVQSRQGQRPINEGDTSQGACLSSSRSCYKSLKVQGTGNYEVTYFCEPVDTKVGCGLSVWGQGDDLNAVAGLFNLNVGSIADFVAGVAGKDTDFADKSLFTNNPINVHAGMVDDKPVLQLQFSNPNNYDLNRASHGYLLINLFYADFKDNGCQNNCRPFPDRAPQDIMSGVSDSFPQGDARHLDYDIFIDRNKWNPLVNELPQTFQITACYLYTTTVTPAVCVDPTPQNNANDPCNPNVPIVFKESQGAPIKVSRIESRAIPGAMQYTIYVEKVDKNGQVWLPGALDQCSPYTPNQVDRRLMDAVQLIDVRVSGEYEQLTCLPTTNDERIVRLENGRGQITCVYSLRNGYTTPTAAYSTSLTLEFGYLYQNTIRKNVIIHRT